MNRRLLVVDDEPGVLDAYRIILQPVLTAQPRLASSRHSAAAQSLPTPQSAEAFEVSYATNAESALQAIEAAVKIGKPFAGGFFDVKLGPGIDGIETIRRAIQIDPELLCCIVTAYQDRSLDEIHRIFGDAFSDQWDFLSKPFSHNEIQQKARHLSLNWDRRKREKLYLEQIRSQQDQLIRSERLAAVGGLARGIAHELGNLLHRVIGISELSLQKADPVEMNNALHTIIIAAERAGNIVRNLQSLVKMESKREPLNLYEPFQECRLLLDHELRQAGVVLEEKWAPTLPRVQANRTEIGQVFLNLLINAVHAMEPNGGKITVRSYGQDHLSVVEITDTGCGIPAENLTQIFEPLFTTKGDKGTGIGLSISRKILTNHNGRIEVLSQPGKGTTFKLSFPALRT